MKRYVGGLRRLDGCEHVYISTLSPVVGANAPAGRIKQQGWCIGSNEIVTDKIQEIRAEKNNLTDKQKYSIIFPVDPGDARL